MPEAPTDAEKYLYVQSNKLPLYLFAVLSTVLVTTGGLLFSIHRPGFIWYSAFVVTTGVYLAVSYFIGIFSKPFNIAAHRNSVGANRGYQPSVDVYLPCASEPLDVIANTYHYVAALDWPADRLAVYVLDDSGREEIAALAAQYGFTYVARPNRGELKKAGNIRYTFPNTSGDLLAIFDADFCPRPDYIDEVAHYFVDPKVGILQTPQYFRPSRSQPAIQRGSAAVQELFYRLIQVSRDHWGASICVGTCAVYRRVALEPFGGTYPIEHSEDVHTGFNLLKSGWTVKYCPIILAAGLCPDTLAAFLTQQYRWCLGSTTLMMSREFFWGAKLPLRMRLCFMSGMTYYSVTALSIFVMPIPSMMMMWLSPDDVHWWNVCFSLPSFLLGTVFMMWWNRSEFGLSAVVARHASYWAHAFALKDKLFGSVMPWVPTGDSKKAKGTKRVKQIRAAILIWTVVTTAVGWVGAIRAMDGVMDYDFWPYFLISGFYCWLHLSCLWADRVPNSKDLELLK